jgi:lipoic acid synthetase
MSTIKRDPSRDRMEPAVQNPRPQRRPEWIRVRPPSGTSYRHVQELINVKVLHTVCEEAHCPNIGECFGSGTATFLVLGDVCTRACKFCDVKHGRPGPIDWDEPERVAQAVKSMNLQHAVITSVNRDNRKDGGAPIFAQIITRIRELQPACSVEVLIPDFKGSLEALKIVMDAHPDILNHNLEVVPRLSKEVQPQNRMEWSRDTLVNAKWLDPHVLTKSGLMVGMGEDIEEVKAAMRDLRVWDVDILTIGQYLQPSRRHWPIARYYHLEEFTELKRYGEEIGFKWVESGPLVRSSYHAAEQVRTLSERYGRLSAARQS